MTVNYNILVSILTGMNFTKSIDEWNQIENGEACILKNVVSEWKSSHPSGQPFDAFSPEGMAMKENYILVNFPELIPLNNELKANPDMSQEERMAVVEKYRSRCADSFQIEATVLENTRERQL